MTVRPSEYCSGCGVAITEPSAFCSNCGTPTQQVTAEAASTRSAAGTAAGVGAGVTATPAPVSPGTHAATPASTATQQATPLGAPPTQGMQPPGAPLPTMQPPGAPPPATPPVGTQPPAQPPSSSAASRNWLPLAAILGAALVTASVVVILLVALGGSAGRNVRSASVTRTQALQLLAANGITTVSRAAPGLFAAVHAGRLSAIVPAGWHATAQAASSATRAEFSNPAQPNSTLTIVEEQGVGGSDRDRALTARKSVAAKGFTQSGFGAITFPGGRSAWRLTYTSGGVIHSTYFYSACNGTDAMVIDVSAASQSFAHEQATLETAAANAEPQC